MYKVPMEIPNHCNLCPFGMCYYNKPKWAKHIERSKIDEAFNNRGTYGYVCNIDFQDNKKYTKVMREEMGNDIEKPVWCKLEEVL